MHANIAGAGALTRYIQTYSFGSRSAFQPQYAAKPGLDTPSSAIIPLARFRRYSSRRLRRSDHTAPARERAPPRARPDARGSTSLLMEIRGGVGHAPSRRLVHHAPTLMRISGCSLSTHLPPKNAHAHVSSYNTSLPSEPTSASPANTHPQRGADLPPLAAMSSSAFQPLHFRLKARFAQRVAILGSYRYHIGYACTRLVV